MHDLFANWVGWSREPSAVLGRLRGRQLGWASSRTAWCLCIVAALVNAPRERTRLLAAPVDLGEVVVEVVVGPTEPAPPADLPPGVLNAPFAVAFEPEGTEDAGAMWIVEYDGGRLMRLEPNGTLVHVAGDAELGYADGPAKAARFNKLHHLLRLPDGQLLMSDHLNHAVRMYDPRTDQVSSLAGDGTAGFAGDGGPFAEAKFHRPICVDRGSEAGTVLVADINNRRLRLLDLRSGTVKTLAGNGERGVPEDGAIAVASPLVDPRAAIAAADGTIYLLERSGHALRRIDPDGRIYTVAGTVRAGRSDGEALQAELNGPKHLCWGPGGVIFIADDVNHLIRCYDPKAGTLTTVSMGPYRLKRPHGVHVRDGWLYVADSFHHRILRRRL